MGRDLAADAPVNARALISIHAPRVGRDVRGVGVVADDFTFQSTRPVWGATRLGRHAHGISQFQSTRPVWGATRTYCALHKGTVFQSTRPVWGATTWMTLTRLTRTKFQSTRPVWGATCFVVLSEIFAVHFNPRAPCGARPHYPYISCCGSKFQSTRPVWGATGVEVI